MGDLIEKWAAGRDLVHRGRSRYGIATGQSLRRGQRWSAIGGVQLLCRGTSYDGIETDRPVGAAQANSTTIQQFTWIGQAANTTYFFTVIPVGRGGVESVSNTDRPQIVKVLTDDDGDVPSPVPAAPRNLRATGVSGGAFKLAWDYIAPGAGVRVAKFNLYSNSGSGDVDYNTPVATVTARLGRLGAGKYVYETGAFDHAAYVRWAVRAADASDNEEKNTATAIAQADAEGPTAHGIFRAEYGADE